MTSPNSTPVINTGHVGERRKLRFHSIDEALAEANRLAEADRQGKFRRLGNWTLGQNLGHVASWVEYSYTGAPLKIPFAIRIILRLFKKRFLYKRMPAGSKIPGIAGGTLGTELLSTEEGLSRFNAAFTRLNNECPQIPHLIFGRLTHDEWINGHLRHAELHLGSAEVTQRGGGLP